MLHKTCATVDYKYLARCNVSTRKKYPMRTHRSERDIDTLDEKTAPELGTLATTSKQIP